MQKMSSCDISESGRGFIPFSVFSERREQNEFWISIKDWSAAAIWIPREFMLVSTSKYPIGVWFEISILLKVLQLGVRVLGC